MQDVCWRIDVKMPHTAGGFIRVIAAVILSITHRIQFGDAFAIIARKCWGFTNICKTKTSNEKGWREENCFPNINKLVLYSSNTPSPLVQPSSSEPSLQSAFPSHFSFSETHWSFLHLNSPTLHPAREEGDQIRRNLFHVKYFNTPLDWH